MKQSYNIIRCYQIIYCNGAVWCSIRFWTIVTQLHGHKTKHTNTSSICCCLFTSLASFCVFLKDVFQMTLFFNLFVYRGILLVAALMYFSSFRLTVWVICHIIFVIPKVLVFLPIPNTDSTTTSFLYVAWPGQSLPVPQSFDMKDSPRDPQPITFQYNSN